MWRHIQEKGLSTKYSDDHNFRLNARKLLSLPFVPASEVIEAFELIADEFDDEADALIEYYEKTIFNRLFICFFSFFHFL